MKIRADEIKATTIPEIIKELESKPEIIEIIRGHNLRGGDALESMSSELVQDIDIDTDDYLHIS